MKYQNFYIIHTKYIKILIQIFIGILMYKIQLYQAHKKMQMTDDNDHHLLFKIEQSILHYRGVLYIFILRYTCSGLKVYFNFQETFEAR